MPFPYPFPIIFDEWPAMAVVIQDEIQDILKGSISVSEHIEERSVASFVVEDVAEAQSYQRGEPIRIYDTTDTLVFSGFIGDPGKGRIAPAGGLYHDIVCMDNHYLADKRLVVAAYTATDAGDIVTALHTNYLASEGIGIGSIQTGPEIAEAIFNYVSVSEALDALAELAGFTWFIDELKDLYFVDRATYAAPWTATTDDMVKNTPHLFGGNPMYRNRQYVRGGTALTSIPPAAGITETFVADNTQDSFTVGYPIALKPTIVDSGLGARTVGIKGIDTGFHYYWNKGDATVYAATTPVVPNTVAITYYGQYPLISMSTDEGERIARQTIEGGTGIIENVVDEAYHNTRASSEESSKAKLDHYCRTAARFNYQTIRSGIKPGQLQTVDYPLLGLNNTEMLIESVLITGMGSTMLYDIQAIVGPVTGSWTKFFTRIFRAGAASIRIGDTLLLVLLQQLDGLIVSEAVADHQDDFSGGEVNRSIALPPTQGALHNVEHERLTVSETPSDTQHLTKDYHWTDGDKWNFATWK